MNSNYIFGGFLKVGGTLDNGKPWTGLRLMLAPIDNKTGGAGWKVNVVKASYSDSLFDTLRETPPGAPVTAYFDDEGRLAIFERAKTK